MKAPWYKADITLGELLETLASRGQNDYTIPDISQIIGSDRNTVADRLRSAPVDVQPDVVATRRGKIAGWSPRQAEKFLRWIAEAVGLPGTEKRRKVETRICANCGPRPIEEFSRYGALTYQSVCVACNKETASEHHKVDGKTSYQQRIDGFHLLKQAAEELMALPLDGVGEARLKEIAKIARSGANHITAMARRAKDVQAAQAAKDAE